MDKEFIHPEALSNYPTRFTQVVTVKSGGTKTIYISGQVSIDEQGKVVGEGDLEAQTEQVFKNLTLALEAAGAKPEDVVKLNTYVVNFKPQDGKTIGLARRKFFNPKDLPASTLVGVQALVSPQFLLEVEATAVVDG